MKYLSFPFAPTLPCLLLLAICSSANATDLVLKKDVPRVVATPRNGRTQEVLIEVKAKTAKGKPEIDAQQLAALKKLPFLQLLPGDSQMGILKFQTPNQAEKAIAALRKDPKIRSASFNRYLPHRPHGFVANDPYFPQQWHLNNPGAAQPGVGVAGPWSRDFTGKGVVIGIVDEGVEDRHEDLASNFDAKNSHDFNGRDPNPAPRGEEDAESHGTSVAGVAAGTGGNGIGITGAAPQAKIAGLKITFDGYTSLAGFLAATKYHSFGSDRRITIKNHSYGFSSPYIDDPEEEMAFNDSANAGTIHTVSAGNDRFPYGSNADGTDYGDVSEDSNKSILSNNPNIICVGALASSGIFAEYSSLGSNLFVTASSSSFRKGELSILTTDRSRARGYNRVADDSDDDPFADLNYTDTFGGTSSSAPLVAGVLALVKQANPALDVRRAKHLLARTSIQVDPTNPTWTTNAAGYHFSIDYGFGLIDANAMVNNAKNVAISPLQIRQSPILEVNQPVPDQGSISRELSFGRTGRIEEIQVRLVVQAEYEGDLEATITSPAGTVSKFCHASAYDSATGTLDWWFTSNAFWGETGSGVWTITVADTAQGDALTWTSAQLRIRSDTVAGARAPANDSVENANRLSGRKFSRSTNLDLASGEDREPGRSNREANHSVWYRWIAPQDGRLTIDTAGSKTDTVLALYRGSTFQNFREIASNNDVSILDKTSVITADVRKGVEYYMAIDLFEGPANGVRLNGVLRARPKPVSGKGKN